MVVRDRKYGICDWNDFPVLFIDTGGMLGNEELSSNIHDQATLAIEEADAIVFITDYVSGVTEPDRNLSKLLRKTKKPITLIVNKCGK